MSTSVTTPMQGVRRETPKNMKTKPLSGTATAIAGVAGQVTRIWRLVFAPSAATTLNIKDDTTSMTGDMTLSSLVLPMGDLHWFEGAAGNTINIEGGATMAGAVWYTQD